MTTSEATRRRVLEAVPPVGFYPDMRRREPDRAPEDFIFPSCMRAVMQHLGRPQFDYIHFMGVTGAMSFLNWKPGWHGDNPAIYYMATLAEHVKLFDQAYDSAGLERASAMLRESNDAIDEPAARRVVIQAIDAGFPLLAHGVVGPPETSIICGYDEGGEVLIGWSFFQNGEAEAAGLAFEPNGMFRRRDWFGNTWDLTAITGLREPEDLKTVRRRSLAWAVEVARTTPTWGDRHNGLAAYDAWAEHLLRDDDIDAQGTPPAGTKDRPFDVHDDAVGTVAEGRWYGGRYLARVAGEEPKMAAHLYQAAACYAGEHDLMWKVWGCVGGHGRSTEHIQRFADAAVRRRIAECVLEARRLDEKAIEHIEAALNAEGLAP